MVTCNSSHVIEAPGKAGVGSGLISVAVGWRNGVAGRCVVEVWPAEEQAVKMHNPLNKIATVFFIGALEFNPILIRMSRPSVSRRSLATKKASGQFHSLL